jgi:hypothetical protein
MVNELNAKNRMILKHCDFGEGILAYSRLNLRFVLFFL